MRISTIKAVKADALALYRATYGTKGANNAALWAALKNMIGAVKRIDQAQTAIRLINLCLEGKSEFARALWAAKKVAARKSAAKTIVVKKDRTILNINLRSAAAEIRDEALTSVGLWHETAAVKKASRAARKSRKVSFKGADVIRFVGKSCEKLAFEALDIAKKAAQATKEAWDKLFNGAMSIVAGFQYLAQELKAGLGWNELSRFEKKYVVRAYRCADIASLYI